MKAGLGSLTDAHSSFRLLERCIAERADLEAPHGADEYADWHSLVLPSLLLLHSKVSEKTSEVSSNFD